MKEIGIFKIDKNLCSNCREDENCPQKYSVNGNCLHIEKGLAIEQVPETFEELEKLVMEKCRGFTIRHDGIENKNAIECKGFIFHDCGVVEFEIKTKTIDEDLVIFTRCVAECMEFAQMWEMIKALTGEGK